VCAHQSIHGTFRRSGSSVTGAMRLSTLRSYLETAFRRALGRVQKFTGLRNILRLDQNTEANVTGLSRTQIQNQLARDLPTTRY